MVVTKHGTTVRLQQVGDETLVLLSKAEDPAWAIEAGRLTFGGRGFTPALSAPDAMTPDVLRAIADLIEENEGN